MGIGFKELAFQDIQNVFLNPEEFGEYHMFGGRKMLIIVDSNEVEERGKKQFEHSRIDGIYEDNILVYVSRKDFGEQPARGHAIQLDGRTYRVTDSRDEGGVYSITLRRYQS